jgi:hypothetical protein
MTDKERVTASVSPGVFDTLDDEAERREISRSAAVTEIVKEWEQYRDELDEALSEVDQLRGQLNSERERREQVERERRELAEQAEQATPSGGASTVGVVSAVLGPVLFAVGQAPIAVPFLVVGAVFVLLWATGYDQYDDELVAEARAELAEHGGVRGFFRAVFLGDPVIDDPSTVFERAANADRYVPIVSLAALIVALPVGAAYEAGALSAFVETLGAWGALGYLLLLTGAMYLIPVILGVSAVASLAVATARTPTHEEAPEAE